MTETLPTKIKRVYKRLMLRELSLVDEPCVPGSDVLVIKARGGKFGRDGDGDGILNEGKGGRPAKGTGQLPSFTPPGDSVGDHEISLNGENWSYTWKTGENRTTGEPSYEYRSYGASGREDNRLWVTASGRWEDDSFSYVGKGLSPDPAESFDKDDVEGKRSPGGAPALEDDQVEKALEPFRLLTVQLEASDITLADFADRAAGIASDLQNQSETGGTPVAKSAAAAALAIVTESTVNLEQLNAAYNALNTKVLSQTAELNVAKARNTELEGLVAVEKARADAAEVEVAKAKPKTAEEEDAEVLKSLPESIRATVLKARETETNAEIDAEVTKAKALKLAEPDEVGKAMRTLRKAAPEALAVVEKALAAKSATTNASEAIFKSYGASAETLNGDDPEALLQAKADDIRKARPELSKEGAYAAALEANPDLYTAAITKRRVGAHLTAQ